MLVSCLDCGKREYTDISPLWFTCDKCLKRSYCSCCGIQLLKTKLNDGLCKPCTKQQQEQPMYYCEGCGDDYPRSHLLYVDIWNGYFCDRCSIMEDEA